MSANVGLKEAGRALGIGAETVAAIVKAGHWRCIGACAVQQPDSTKWTYVIPRAGFQRLVDGDLSILVQIGTQATKRDDAARAFWPAA